MAQSVGIDRVFCCYGYSLGYVNIPHDLELKESEWLLIHKAFSAVSHACMNHAQAALQLS
jgi:hypothetical protein